MEEMGGGKEIRIMEINEELNAIKAVMRAVNARYADLQNERWGLQCDLMQPEPVVDVDFS